MRGVHLSPATEFKKGQRSANHMAVGSTRIRYFRRSGERRAFIKIAEPNVWRLRAHVIWEAARGPIPQGGIVHHEDRNTLNDAITNLRLETRASHLLEHRPEFEAKRRAALQSRKTSKSQPPVA